LKDEWDRALDVKRTFTDIGFARSKLPLDLFGSMSAYHYNNRDNMVPEEWNDGGVIVNWWEADVFMVHIPFELKVRNSCILNMYVYMYICFSGSCRDTGRLGCRSSWRRGRG
jgi:hypothetical protein